MKKYYIIYIILFSVLALGCTDDSIDMASGSLIGTVRVKDTNEPLENVKITTTPSTETVYTDEDGKFEIIESMPLGDYSVKAELNDYVTQLEPISLKDFNQTISVAFELSADESLNVSPDIPTLISPEDLATNLPVKVLLKWQSSDADNDSLTYKVILKNNKTNLTTEYNDLSKDTLNLNHLSYGTTYTWQVAVSDGVNDSVFSKSNQFTTLLTPANPYYYSRIENDNYVIRSTNLDSDIAVTESSISVWRPHKNIIAQKLAFLKNISGQAHLVVSDLMGENQKQVSHIPLNGFRQDLVDFAWKTDGSKLIFPSFDKLYKVAQDGTGQQQIYQTTDGQFIIKCAWSYDSSKIAIVTNNIDGYEAKIIILSSNGNYLETIFENQLGAVGGIDWNITGNKLVYSYDISGNQDSDYRQLDTSIFIYDFTNQTTSNISEQSNKPLGTNDTDPRFSPNDAQIIFTNSSNVLYSMKAVYSIDLEDLIDSRNQLIPNAEMPDYQ